MSITFETFEFPISAAFFVNFYEGATIPDSAVVKYGCAWPVDETPADLVEFVYENDFGLVKGSSNNRPVITEASGDYGLLGEKFDLAALRNIRRDRLFSSMPLTLVVQPWRLEPGPHRVRRLTGLAIVEVIVDARELHYREFADTPKHPKRPS